MNNIPRVALLALQYSIYERVNENTPVAVVKALMEVTDDIEEILGCEDTLNPEQAKLAREELMEYNHYRMMAKKAVKGEWVPLWERGDSVL